MTGIFVREQCPLLHTALIWAIFPAVVANSIVPVATTPCAWETILVSSTSTVAILVKNIIVKVTNTSFQWCVTLWLHVHHLQHAWSTVQHIAGTLIPMPGNIVDTPILSIDRLLFSLLYRQYETSGLWLVTTTLLIYGHQEKIRGQAAR